jgi:hypothetical protein
MHANRIRDITRDDKYTKEGVEYRAPYWELILKYRRMSELEREMELSLLIAERHELHRKCKDNDKPGKRHMLPFVWTRKYGVNGEYVDIQVPLRVGHPAYTREMDRLDAKIKEVRNGR